MPQLQMPKLKTNASALSNTPPVTKPTLQPVKSLQNPTAPTPPPSLSTSATAELKEIINTQGITAPAPAPPMSMAQSNAILPKLSITDQLSELEKITESIKNNNFDSNQMEIVREELIALSDSMSSKGTDPLSGVDQALWNLRKTRLAEALSLLPRA